MMLLANTVIVGGMYLISVIRLNRSDDGGGTADELLAPYGHLLVTGDSSCWPVF
jgi:hypothetical protein